MSYATLMIHVLSILLPQTFTSHPRSCDTGHILASGAMARRVEEFVICTVTFLTGGGPLVWYDCLLRSHWMKLAYVAVCDDLEACLRSQPRSSPAQPDAMMPELGKRIEQLQASLRQRNALTRQFQQSRL